jgi:hypothetical protein
LAEAIARKSWNTQDTQQKKGLLTAAEYGFTNIAKLLIMSGADLDY